MSEAGLAEIEPLFDRFINGEVGDMGRAFEHFSL